MAFKMSIIAMLAFAGLSPAKADEITFLTHSIEGKSFTDPNGELRGKKHFGRRAFQLELVREMMIKLKFTPRIYQIVPFKRGLAMIKQNRAAYALFNTGKRPDRIGQMKFVGPLTQDINYLYELDAKPSGIKALKDAKGLKLCVNRGGNMDTFATNNGFIDIIRNNYERCFEMLVRGRVQFAAISHLDVSGVLKNANINPSLIQNTKVYLFKSEGSLSFSNQVPDDVIQNWQSALNEIKKSGRYDILLQQYLHPK